MGFAVALPMSNVAVSVEISSVESSVADRILLLLLGFLSSILSVLLYKMLVFCAL